MGAPETGSPHTHRPRVGWCLFVLCCVKGALRTFGAGHSQVRASGPWSTTLADASPPCRARSTGHGMSGYTITPPPLLGSSLLLTSLPLLSSPSHHHQPTDSLDQPLLLLLPPALLIKMTGRGHAPRFLWWGVSNQRLSFCYHKNKISKFVLASERSPSGRPWPAGLPPPGGAARPDDPRGRRCGPPLPSAPIARVLGCPRLWAARRRRETRTTQGSVQIVLIFRLLLKITVDWPFHAIHEFL